MAKPRNSLGRCGGYVSSAGGCDQPFKHLPGGASRFAPVRRSVCPPGRAPPAAVSAGGSSFKRGPIEISRTATVPGTHPRRVEVDTTASVDYSRTRTVTASPTLIHVFPPFSTWLRESWRCGSSLPCRGGSPRKAPIGSPAVDRAAELLAFTDPAGQPLNDSAGFLERGRVVAGRS